MLYKLMYNGEYIMFNIFHPVTDYSVWGNTQAQHSSFTRRVSFMRILNVRCRIVSGHINLIRSIVDLMMVNPIGMMQPIIYTNRYSQTTCI